MTLPSNRTRCVASTNADDQHDTMAAAVAQSRYELGDTGEIVLIQHHGESAAATTLFGEFGFSPKAVVGAAERSPDNYPTHDQEKGTKNR
jgi:transketolase